MKIHQAFLTHDGVAPSTTGKVIDLGFNGDFDMKQSEWNMIFVQFAGKNSGTDMTVSAYTKQANIATSPVIVNSANLIGTLVVPAATVQKGGVLGIRIPGNGKNVFPLIDGIVHKQTGSAFFRRFHHNDTVGDPGGKPVSLSEKVSGTLPAGGILADQSTAGQNVLGNRNPALLMRRTQYAETASSGTQSASRRGLIDAGG